MRTRPYLRRRRWTIISLALGLSLAACGGTSAENDDTPSEVGPDVTEPSDEADGGATDASAVPTSPDVEDAGGEVPVSPDGGDEGCDLSACPEPDYPEVLKCCTYWNTCGFKNGASGYCYAASPEDLGPSDGGHGRGGWNPNPPPGWPNPWWPPNHSLPDAGDTGDADPEDGGWDEDAGEGIADDAGDGVIEDAGSEEEFGDSGSSGDEP